MSLIRHGPTGCGRWAASPPEPDRLREVYELGYRDALRWLATNGRIPYGAPACSGACMRACREAHHHHTLRTACPDEGLLSFSGMTQQLRNWTNRDIM